MLPGFYALVDHSFDESAAKNGIVQCWCDSHFGRRRRRRKRNRKKKNVNHYSNRRKFRVACRLRNECTGRRTKPPRKRCRKKQTGRNGEVGSCGNGRATNQSLQAEVEEAKMLLRELFPEEYSAETPSHPSDQPTNDIHPAPEYNDATNTESHIHCKF